jgi:hypothetical protein
MAIEFSFYQQLNLTLPHSSCIVKQSLI